MVGGPGRDLPWCNGPKLAAFKFQSHDQGIILRKHLGSAVHSHVFEVVIDGTTYALKMFKFLDPHIYWPYAGSEKAPLNVKDLIHHKDPFHSECRAFGRLKEAGRESLAVRCYGYIIIGGRLEEEILRKFRIGDWDRSKRDEGKPIRAIVKELIQADLPFVPKMIPRMMRDLRALNRLGIQVWDVKEDMYLGGVLLDLSQARTVPHVELDLESGIWTRDSILLEEGALDYGRFDAYVIDSWNQNHEQGEQIWHRFEPSHRYRKHLRARPKEYIDPKLPLAALCDWKKISKKRKGRRESATVRKNARTASLRKKKK